MNGQIHYDIIADIHGQHDKFTALMTRLGYRKRGERFVPPAGHRALFLGDLIDPKPGYGSPGGVRATLRAVKSMCDHGDGICLMGNHEFNAICYHTRGITKKWLRSHDTRNKEMHMGTLDEFPDHEDLAGEWNTVWLPWFKQLPLFIDLGGLRAVHACWNPDHLARLAGKSLLDDAFLHAASDESTPEGSIIEICLKGPKVRLPHGNHFRDPSGNVRSKFRARWWDPPKGNSLLSELVFPENKQIPAIPIHCSESGVFSRYHRDEPPLIFGHYSKPADSEFYPECHNLACIDHSAATDGPLMAYCWEGECQLDPNHYVSHLSNTRNDHTP
jgi:hypothetical protein